MNRLAAWIAGAAALILAALAFVFGRKSAPVATAGDIARAAEDKAKAKEAAAKTVVDAVAEVKAADDKAAKEAHDASLAGLAGYLNNR